MIKADVLEAETFLYKYPDIEAVDLLLPDTCGRLRGKRIRRDGLSKVYNQGVALPASIFGTTVTGDTVEATGLGFAEGDADRICWPVSDTLRLAPWQPRPMAQVLLAMAGADEQPFHADPRQVLGRVIETFRPLALTPVIALELEFYLIDRERTAALAPQPPFAPATVRRESQTQVYGIRELEVFDAVLEDVIAAADKQELPVDTVVSEYAPGQYEINLKHVANAVEACDHALMLKRLVKAIAQQHGFDATFMAKPYDDWSGNGMHAHLSLQSDDGNNAFASAEPLGNGLMQQAIGGMLATTAQAMALFAPGANSYRRYQIDSYVPLSPCWGHNNRTLALRIPTGPDAARRIEHRVAGADANPYLMVAAVLAGAHHGIDTELSPPEPVSGNAYQQQSPSLPTTWPDALAAFERADVMAEYLGADFCRIYALTKRAELAEFDKRVTSLEHAWYL